MSTGTFRSLGSAQWVVIFDKHSICQTQGWYPGVTFQYDIISFSRGLKPKAFPQSQHNTLYISKLAYARRHANVFVEYSVWLWIWIITANSAIHTCSDQYTAIDLSLASSWTLKITQPYMTTLTTSNSLTYLLVYNEIQGSLTESLSRRTCKPVTNHAPTGLFALHTRTGAIARQLSTLPCPRCSLREQMILSMPKPPHLTPIFCMVRDHIPPSPSWFTANHAPPRVAHTCMTHLTREVLALLCHTPSTHGRYSAKYINKSYVLIFRYLVAGTTYACTICGHDFTYLHLHTQAYMHHGTICFQRGPKVQWHLSSWSPGYCHITKKRSHHLATLTHLCFRFASGSFGLNMPSFIRYRWKTLRLCSYVNYALLTWELLPSKNRPWIED